MKYWNYNKYYNKKHQPRYLITQKLPPRQLFPVQRVTPGYYLLLFVIRVSSSEFTNVTGISYWHQVNLLMLLELVIDVTTTTFNV